MRFDLEWLRRAISRQPERREEFLHVQKDFERKWQESEPHVVSKGGTPADDEYWRKRNSTRRA
jgi:hypothetical protein